MGMIGLEAWFLALASLAMGGSIGANAMGNMHWGFGA
jgi:hypothetical protein